MNTSPKFSGKHLFLTFFAFLFWITATDALAQFATFGKNRVQYKQFDWRYIQSEHFDVYYYQSKNYDLANFTAISLEASLQQISEDFGHQIADRIQVIIYDSHNDFSETNVVSLPTSAEGIGGVTDLFKNRITMPFTGNYAKFRSTLQHELVHAVINDMFFGGSIQSLVNGGVNLQIPLWFNEGLAEYESLGWDTETDMWIRDATINDYLPPIPRLGGFFAYRGGQSVWNFIAEEYGREKIREIMQSLKNLRNVEAAFRRSLGLSMKELSNRWEDFYEKRYLPEVAEREQLDNFATLLTERGKAGNFNTSPALSPQGDKLAMITNERGFLDVVVINAITGEKIKTLIQGGDNIDFEELNILEPNLSWSPDGSKITLSTKTKGSDNLAIVDYNTGKVQKVEFPRLDAMGSVAWSPDGKKIAFDGSIGPFQDIFVYNVETREFTNVTNDAISDSEPTWSADSRTIYFTSSRGDNVLLNEIKRNSKLLEEDYVYTTDIYSVNLGSKQATRLTKTPSWNEKQPETTGSGRLIFISDKNGIPNVYELNLEDRTISALTNLQTGVMQISVSADGSRLAVNSINEGFTDIFLIRSPFTRTEGAGISDNQWAERRNSETPSERVPAIGYVKKMVSTPGLSTITDVPEADSAAALKNIEPPKEDNIPDPKDEQVPEDSLASDTTDTTGNIDFRNYVFETEVVEDTTFTATYLEEDVFDIENNVTEDGRYQPRDYRLRFTTDLVVAGGNFSTTFGANGITQVVFSDLLGDHQIAFGSNFRFDLRNSNYFIQYSYLKQRTNWLFDFFHTSRQFQTFGGELFRFRTFGSSVTARYPFDKFRRIDMSLSVIGLAQDESSVSSNRTRSQNSTFLFPQVIYTQDNTLPGFLSPRAGSRYSISLTGSPPLGSLEFASILGDYRKYFNLGGGYSLAFRGSGASSFGSNSQTFFLGGMLGWINPQFEGNSFPVDELGDTFFSLPALPLRGYGFNAISGDRYAMTNIEFRFPLSGLNQVPILPGFNFTGVAFFDAGTAWGQDIPFNVVLNNGNSLTFAENDAELNFKVRQEESRFIQLNDDGSIALDNGEPIVVEADERIPGLEYSEQEISTGDVVLGTGFGIRTILLGLPFRYDVGWPYFRDGFDNNPVHYVTIGIDF